MASTVVNVKLIEDNSIEKVISRNSKKLSRKYGRRRSEVNEDFLDAENSPIVKILSLLLTLVTIVITGVSVILCMGTIVSSINHTPAMFFGYSMMQVATGSMTANSITIDGVEYESGFQIGDKIVIRAVDTKTLKIGDKIAFYAYSQNYVQYHNVSKEEISVPADTQTSYKTTFGQFFGFHTSQITNAAKNNGMLTFHHITNVYRDQNGKLWFKTQGSANANKDTWFISEEMVVGIYSGSKFGLFLVKVNQMMSSTLGFILILLVPIFLLVLNLVHSFARDLQLSLIELDIVEEKRKLTDPICIKNKIGYRMDTKTKYKVLCQANDDEKLYYISLLWHDGTAPNAIKKYVIRKRYILAPNKQLLDLNRECEKMYNEGKSMSAISKYYTQRKTQIQEKVKENEIRMKNMQKRILKAKGEKSTNV